MKRLKISIFFSAAYLISHLSAIICAPSLSSFPSSVIIPSLGVLAGLIIAAVGMFLGSLGNFYTLIELSYGVDYGKAEAFLSTTQDCVKELKDDVLFVMSALVSVVALHLFRDADIPWLSWPLTSRYFTKPIVWSALILTAFVSSVAAIIDAIQAIFVLHNHYVERIRQKLKNG